MGPPTTNRPCLLQVFMHAFHSTHGVWRLFVQYFPGHRLCNGSMRALEGPLAVNAHLKQAQYLFQGDMHGPEAFVRDERGKERGREREEFQSCAVSASLAL